MCFMKNKDKKVYPASVTKVMSILLTVEALDSGKIKINDKVTASKMQWKWAALKFGSRLARK